MPRKRKTKEDIDFTKKLIALYDPLLKIRKTKNGPWQYRKAVFIAAKQALLSLRTDILYEEAFEAIYHSLTNWTCDCPDASSCSSCCMSVASTHPRRRIASRGCLMIDVREISLPCSVREVVTRIDRCLWVLREEK